MEIIEALPSIYQFNHLLAALNTASSELTTEGRNPEDATEVCG